MDLAAAIDARYSYRGDYLDKAVSKDDLKKIVAAGLAAPSGKNAQTTNFVVVDDPRLLSDIGTMHIMPAMQQASMPVSNLSSTKTILSTEMFFILAILISPSG